MPIPKAVAALVAVVLLGACSGDDPTPEELRRDRVEERLGDTFPPAQVTCILDGLDDATLLALDQNQDLEADSTELTTYSFVVRACAADPAGAATTTTGTGAGTATTAEPAATTTAPPGGDG